MIAALWLIAGSVVGAFNGLILTKSVHRVRHDAVQQSTIWLVAAGGLRWIATVSVISGAVNTGIAAGLLAASGVWLAYRVTAFLASNAHDGLWPPLCTRGKTSMRLGPLKSRRR